MVVCTSISPVHPNNQLRAVKSWQDLGLIINSFNHPSEISELKQQYNGVNFIATDRTMELTYKKPLVQISAVLDWMKGQTQSHFCIINSDIELKTDNTTIVRIQEEMKTAIVLCNRIDYENENIYEGKQYQYGIDVFFIHKKFVHLYPQSMFCFGQCFWDYEIPYIAAKKGIEVTFLKQTIAFHKKHSFQYNEDEWKKAGRYFLWHNELYQFDDIHGIGKMSTYIYNYIYNYAKRKQI